MDTVLLVLCQNGDTSAEWAFSRLQRRSRPVELVHVEDLAAPTTTWDLRVNTAGVQVRAVLSDGREVGRSLAAVLNRMIYPPASILSVASPGDADYTQSELTAFAVSWLTALAPTVVNAPTAGGLSGRWRSALHWRALAARAGLPVVPFALDSRVPVPVEPAEDPSTMVLCLGGQLLADAPSSIRNGASELTRLAGTPILGLRFAGADPARAGWRLLDATPHPDLSVAGEAGIDVLEEVLAA